MSAPCSARASRDGLTFTAYRRDGCALLAFDLDESLSRDLAGFAVQYTPPGGEPEWVLNRLSFTRGITSGTTPSQRRWTPTNVAPLQKFQWAHFPPDVAGGSYRYRTTAMLFVEDDGSKLAEGPSVELDLPLVETEQARFELGLTRGYISSQAYADRFGSASIRPKPPTLDYDTGPFEPFRAEWSGGSRQVIHHKFVVVDFNDSAPVVFTGSSNLAAGGEKFNGDNLLAIYDRAAATAYAVEAIRLVDHYNFRALQQRATSSAPLRLRTRAERWWRSAYVDGSIRQTARKLFAR